MKFLKNVSELLKRTFKEWQEDDVSRLAAALSYYTIFSLAPLLLIAVAAAGFLWSRNAVEAQVLSQMQELLGEEGANFIQTLMQNASDNLGGGLVATVIGIGALIFGSIGVFRQLRDALNTIWEVKPQKIEGFWNKVKHVLVKNVLSFAMVMGVGFVLLVSLVISAALTALGGYLNGLLPLTDVWMGLVNNLVTLALITLIFAVLFKTLPETTIAWKDVLVGGFVTALLFLVGKFAIGLYLGNSSVGATFGAAGSLALLLIWVYYSAQILFFGAEFTQVYANMYGSKIPPKPEEQEAPPLPRESRTGKVQVQIPRPGGGRAVKEKNT